MDKLDRSRRKLAESEYFLRGLRDTGGKYPEFGYILSAFLSALRSIGFVLQSDLRGRYGERFDAWWEAEKAALPNLAVPFDVIRELRNQALKQGELLPGMVFVLKLKHDVVDEVRFTINTSEGKLAIKREEYKFHTGTGPEISVQNPEDDREFRRKLEAEGIPALARILSELDESKPDFDVSSIGYLLAAGGVPLSFDQVVEGFKKHLDVMRRVVERAEKTFLSGSQKATTENVVSE